MAEILSILAPLGLAAGGLAMGGAGLPLLLGGAAGLMSGAGGNPAVSGLLGGAGALTGGMPSGLSPSGLGGALGGMSAGSQNIGDILQGIQKQQFKQQLLMQGIGGFFGGVGKFFDNQARKDETMMSRQLPAFTPEQTQRAVQMPTMESRLGGMQQRVQMMQQRLGGGATPGTMFPLSRGTVG